MDHQPSALSPTSSHLFQQQGVPVSDHASLRLSQESLTRQLQQHHQQQLEAMTTTTSVSSHSGGADHHQGRENLSPMHADDTVSNSGQPTRAVKSFKTEYKSNFKPFDEYVYNEVTDQFVRSNHHKNMPNNSHNDKAYQGAATPSIAIKVSKSNQDIVAGSQATSDTYSTTTASVSTHDASIYDPNCYVDSQAHNEPWYKEFIKRTEKANEYRFKSEVGHNSPLLNSYNQQQQIESPYSPERQLNSPNDLNLPPHSCAIDRQHQSSDSRSQCSDNHSQVGTPLPEYGCGVRPAYKFTPSDYKRDHMIAEMAKNNNFNLPKEMAASKPAPNSKTQTTSAATRFTTSSAAQVRARSQSSKRVPASTISSVPSKTQQAAKSNQTTPTRTARPTTATTTSSRLSISRVTPKTSNSSPRDTTASSSALKVATTTRRSPTTASSTNSRTITKTLTTSRVSSTTASSATSRVTPTRNVASATKTSSSTAAPRAPLSSRPTTARPPSSASSSRTATSTRPSGRTPVAASSRSSGSSASATPRGSSSASPAAASSPVKSIKTPKALAAAKERANSGKSNAALPAEDELKAEAAKGGPSLEILAATGVGAAAVLAASAATTVQSNESSSFDELDQQVGDFGTKSAEKHIDLTPSQIATEMYAQEESKLIFTTTETGNMLADEIAQAERLTAEHSDLYGIQTHSKEQEPEFTPRAAEITCDIDLGPKSTFRDDFDTFEKLEPEHKFNEPIDPEPVAPPTPHEEFRSEDEPNFKLEAESVKEPEFEHALLIEPKLASEIQQTPQEKPEPEVKPEYDFELNSPNEQTPAAPSQISHQINSGSVDEPESELPPTTKPAASAKSQIALDTDFDSEATSQHEPSTKSDLTSQLETVAEPSLEPIENVDTESTMGQHLEHDSPSDPVAVHEPESSRKKDSVSVIEPITDVRPVVEFDELTHEPEGSELFNGLKGGMVSTEDHFDSSEEISETGSRKFGDQTVNARDQVQEQNSGSNYDDEPYSIMPLNYSETQNAASDNVTTTTSKDMRPHDPMTEFGDSANELVNNNKPLISETQRVSTDKDTDKIEYF